MPSLLVEGWGYGVCGVGYPLIDSGDFVSGEDCMNGFWEHDEMR